MKYCVIFIEQCWQCPYCNRDNNSGDYNGYCHLTKKNNKEIKNICESIPKWCPLQDVKTK